MPELTDLNRTELGQLAFHAGLGNVAAGRTTEEILEILQEGLPATPDALDHQRVTMESHIAKHIKRLRTQLPDCPGQCTSHGCPALIVFRCWEGFREDIRCDLSATGLRRR